MGILYSNFVVYKVYVYVYFNIKLQGICKHLKHQAICLLPMLRLSKHYPGYMIIHIGK